MIFKFVPHEMLVSLSWELTEPQFSVCLLQSMNAQLKQDQIR